MARYRMGFIDAAGATASHYFHADSDANALGLANAIAGQSEAAWVAFDKADSVDASGQANWSQGPVANSTVEEKATMRYTVPAGGDLRVSFPSPADALVTMYSKLSGTDPLDGLPGLQTEEGNAAGVHRDTRWSFAARKL